MRNELFIIRKLQTAEVLLQCLVGQRSSTRPSSFIYLGGNVWSGENIIIMTFSYHGKLHFESIVHICSIGSIRGKMWGFLPVNNANKYEYSTWQQNGHDIKWLRFRGRPLKWSVFWFCCLFICFKMMEGFSVGVLWMSRTVFLTAFCAPCVKALLWITC